MTRESNATHITALVFGSHDPAARATRAFRLSHFYVRRAEFASDSRQESNSALAAPSSASLRIHSETVSPRESAAAAQAALSSGVRRSRNTSVFSIRVTFLSPNRDVAGESPESHSMWVRPRACAVTGTKLPRRERTYGRLCLSHVGGLTDRRNLESQARRGGGFVLALTRSDVTARLRPSHCFALALVLVRTARPARISHHPRT